LRRALKKAATLLARCKSAGKRADDDYNLAISLERLAPRNARRIYARLARSRRPDLAVASLRQLAILHKLDGQPFDALRLLRQAIRRSTRILDQRARCYTQVGMVLDDMADLASARTAYSSALKDFRRLHDHSGMAGALDNLGTIALQLQRWSEADQLFERAFHHAQIAGQDDDVIVIRRNQAYARYQRAKRLLNKGRPMHVVRRDLEEADEHLSEAMVRQPHGEDYAAALTERALTDGAAPRGPAALEELNKAARLHRAQRNRQWLWTTHYNRGVVLLDNGQHKEARLALTRALSLGKALGPSWLARTRELLRQCDG
jgi:tetratricopeptide (TPR) repeat protein